MSAHTMEIAFVCEIKEQVLFLRASLDLPNHIV